ncbi:MAG: PQQ-binding-like beta-propeller repeat protein [Verrucomicrobiales bacterium]|nr:PQQ-binding-like beta-propeller repeat protein [Verrucomicrobiales bacterium]
MKIRRLFACFLIPAISGIALAETLVWPQFRGPDGNGIADADNVPAKFSDSDNVKWKTPLPGKGWSSPVVADGKIWLTTAVEIQATEEEQKAIMAKQGIEEKKFKQLQVAKNVILKLIQADFESGKIEREIELIKLEAPETIHSLNSYASPTPVIDGPNIIAHFGTFGTYCLNRESGEIVWQERLPIQHNVGPGSSPFIHGDLLVLICDGVDVQYVTALNKNTGKEAWKTDRPPMRAASGDQKKAYNTPIAIRDKNGREQIICMGSQWLVSYDPETGRELWKLDHGSGFSVVPRPVYSEKHGLVYISTGFGKPQLWAIDPSGEGDITDSDKVAWREPKRIPAKPSPLIVGDELYVIADGGIATCFDAATGNINWTERVSGNYSASPLFADGNIYFGSHEGKVTVIKAGPAFEVVAENEIAGQIMASPVAFDGGLLMRTAEAIYRFGK